MLKLLDQKEMIIQETKEDINVDILIMGCGISGLLCGYLFDKNKVPVAIINRDTFENEFTPSMYDLDFDLQMLSNKVNDNEVYNLFHYTLDALYQLDGIIDKLEDKCEYKRQPRWLFNNPDKNGAYQLLKDQISYSSGAKINLTKLNQELYHCLKQENIPIYENTEAMEIKFEEERIEITTQNKKKIKCKKMIVTNGVDSLLFFDKPYKLKNKNLLEYKYQLIKDKKINYIFNGMDYHLNNKDAFIEESTEFPNVYFNIGLSHHGFLVSLMGAMFLSDKYLGNNHYQNIFC